MNRDEIKAQHPAQPEPHYGLNWQEAECLLAKIEEDRCVILACEDEIKKLKARLVVMKMERDHARESVYEADLLRAQLSLTVEIAEHAEQADAPLLRQSVHAWRKWLSDHPEAL